MKPKKGILKAILRGILKSVPIGNTIVETVENFKAKTNAEIESGGEVGKVEKPHNWISILTQLTVIGVIVWAFVTKQITIEQLINFLS